MTENINHTLDLDRLQQALGNQIIGHTVYHHISIPSTMPIAHQICKARNPQHKSAFASEQSGAISGAIVVAEEQTAGRGRHQRKWTMPRSSGLAVSICLKAPHLPRNPAHLPMIAAIAALRAIETVTPDLCGKTGIKWPNDLLVETISPKQQADRQTEFKKVGGILLEASFQGEHLAYAIIGIGINVNQKVQELSATPIGAPDATSLYAALDHPILDHPIDRTDLLIALCQEFARVVRNKPSNIYQEWHSSLWTLGQTISIQQQALNLESSTNNKQIMEGVAVDTTADGGLIVEDHHGSRQTFYAGDVSVRTSLDACET